MPKGDHLPLRDKAEIVALHREGSHVTKKFGCHFTMIALKVWKNITPAYLKSLYESMPCLMAAVVSANIGHTKY
jgi:hypothetical protein